MEWRNVATSSITGPQIIGSKSQQKTQQKKKDNENRDCPWGRPTRSKQWEKSHLRRNPYCDTKKLL